jgi:hypothetical protein
MCPWSSSHSYFDEIILTADSRSQLDYYMRCRFPRLSDWNRVLTPQGRRRLSLRRATIAVAMGTLACTILFYHQGWMSGIDNGLITGVAILAICALDFIAETAKRSQIWVAQHVRESL